MYHNLLGQSFIPITPEAKVSLLYLFHALERYLTQFHSGVVFCQTVPQQALQRRVLVTPAISFCSSGKLLSLSDHQKNVQETKQHHQGI